MGEVFRTVEDVVKKWVGPIEAWAVRKGWLKQEVDPNNVDKMRNIPRDLLGLLMLTVCEIHEQDKASLRHSGAEENLQEEAADVFIRLVQLRAEFEMTAWHGMSIAELEMLPYPEEDAGGADVNHHTAYGALCEAVEVWRSKGLSESGKLALIWVWISSAIVLSLGVTVELMEEVDATDEAMLSLLDQWVGKKMAFNEDRPFMHGKTC